MDTSKSAEEATAAVTESTIKTTNKFYKALASAIDTVIKKCLSKHDYSCFEKFYPELALEDPFFFKHAYGQLWSQLEKNFREDMDTFLAEQGVDKKLEELELLIKSKPTNEEMSWRPSGDPNEDIRDHRCKSKLRHLESLQNFLQRFQEANKKLEQTVLDNHEEILNIKRRVFDIDQQNQTKLKVLTENQLCIMEELLSVAEEIN